MPSDNSLRITKPEMSSILKRVLALNLLNEKNPSILFFDLTRLEKRVTEIQNAFPNGTLHAIAVKTNPLIRIMEVLQKMGVGAEAASFMEVEIARHANIAPEKIVYDSPAKTMEDLQRALNSYGIHINADNFGELERIEKLITPSTQATIGLRINPQIGAGAIQSMSVAGIYSKFGVPLGEARTKIINAFLTCPWLTGLHVHSGSQGLGLKMLVKGIESIYNLAEEINEVLAKNNSKNRVTVLDIGGGFPIAYRDSETQLSILDYAKQIAQACPQIFEKYSIITEFGRFVHARSGWVASRVEYIKEQEGFNTIICHVGADLFLRECYNPGDWFHKFSVFDAEGNPRDEKGLLKTYQIAGPLCFGGDFIQKDVDLPVLHEGDYIVIHDSGANAVNLWSRHCSRRIPLILGYEGKAEKGFMTIKNQETTEDILKFWA